MCVTMLYTGAGSVFVEMTRTVASRDNKKANALETEVMAWVHELEQGAEAMRSSVEILKAARTAIIDPEHWTRGAYARDREGRQTPPKYHDAFCFCALGAIRFCAEDDEDDWTQQKAEIFLNRAAPELLPAMGVFSIAPEVAPEVYINDYGGHGDVMRMYDRAIEMAEAEC